MPSKFFNTKPSKLARSAYKAGQAVGKREADERFIGADLKVIYSFICRTLHTEFGFGPDRLERLLNKTQELYLSDWEKLMDLKTFEERVQWCVDRAEKETGISLLFGEEEK